MSLWGENHILAYVRFPRVSGDEPVCAILEYLSVLFSPRERG